MAGQIPKPHGHSPPNFPAAATSHKRRNRPASLRNDDAGDFVAGEKNVIMPEVADDGEERDVTSNQRLQPRSGCGPASLEVTKQAAACALAAADRHSFLSRR